MIDLKSNTLLREIPPNLLVDEKVVNLAKALQISLGEMLDWADKINYKMNMDQLDESIIDHLLWESHITWHEGLNFATTKEQKINLVKSSVKLHRLKGTPTAIQMVMDALQFNGDVQEWFEYEGRPYYFRLVTEDRLTPETNINALIAMVNEFKNVRSWLENITVHRKLDLGLNIGTAFPLYQKTTIKPPDFVMPDISMNQSIGLVHAAHTKTTILAPNFEMPNINIGQFYAGVICVYKKTVIR